MKVKLIVAAILSLACVAEGGVVDVRDFGAKGDGVVKNTAAIQKAVDACSQKGGGEVVFRGGRYLTGMFFLKDNVTLRIDADATLLGSPDCADYPTNAVVRHLDPAKTPRLRTTALIIADECQNVGIVGKGKIDCSGQAFVELSRNVTNSYVNEGQAAKDAPALGDNWTNWKYRRKPGLLSPPRMVLFAGCRNVRVEDITLTNPAAGWGYWVNDCDQVLFRRAKVLTDPEFPNNDGIHINASRDVLVEDCDIVAGDDAVIVRCNSRMLPRTRPCERVTVRNCRLLSHANCIRIGWLNDGTIRDCLFENLTMHDSAGGIGIEVPDQAPGMSDYGCEASRWEDLTFRNITMDRIYSTPIRFVVERDPAHIRIDAIRNLTFSNLVCRSALRFPTFKCAAGMGTPYRDIVFRDCSFVKVPPSALPGNWRKKGAADWWYGHDEERFAGFSGLNFERCAFTTTEGEKPLPKRGLCAHRGDRAAFPENTVPALKSAVAKGAAMVEFDVWRCKTGELVIMHDWTVDRTTTGTGAIERLSFDYIRSLDAGIKKGKAFKGVKVPTFDEAVDCLPKEGLWLNVHCKADVCDEVALKLKAKGRLHQAFVASDPEGVRAARKAVPEIKICLMTGRWGKAWTEREVADYVEYAITNRYDFAQPHCCTLTPALVRRFREAGGTFNFFWLSDPERLPGLFSSGVDFPLVDDLDGMLKAYAAWEKAGCPKAKYVPETSYDGDYVSGNDRPTLAGTAWIEREVAKACARNEKLQAKLKDRTSLEAYRGLVRMVNGTNIWTAALQKALDEHEIVRIPANAQPYYVDDSIIVPSNRRIEAKGATVALLPGTRKLLLRNRNVKDGTLAPISPKHRDSNIAIVGGIWADWLDRRVGYGGSGMFDLKPRKHGNHFGISALFFFNNCDHVSVTDATFRRCSAFALQAGDGKAHRYERIRFDDCFADGLHLNGNLTRVLCRDVRGKVGDDLVALNAYDWLNSSVDFGPQSLILCEDLELQLKDGKGYPAIRILPGKYRYASSNIVDCVISDVIFRRVKGIKAFKMYLQTPAYAIGTPHEWGEVGSGGNLHFEDIAIDLDAPIDNFGSYARSDPLTGHFGAFEFGANLTSVTFKNIDITFHADRWPMSHLATVGPKSSSGGGRETFDPYVNCEVKRVTLDGVRAHGVVPRELVRAVKFEDVNHDGASTGRGRILKLDVKN